MGRVHGSWEGPHEGVKLDTVVAGLWFHQLRAGSRSGGHWAAHRHMLVRLQWGIGGALSHPEPRLPTIGPVPQLPARLPRDPVQTLPTTSTPGGGEGAVPRKPTSLGHELLSPLLSLDPTQAGGASVSPKWGHLQHSWPGVSLVTPTSPTVD